MRPSKCHPNRKLFCVSMGLCRSCYEKHLRTTNPEFAERQRENRRRWGGLHPEKVKSAAERRKTDPLARIRDAHTKRAAALKRNYGMTVSDYATLFEAQKGRCAICQEPKTKRLHVDHDHATGEVRGLLCFRCNYGMRWFQHNVSALIAAGVYLHTPPSRNVL